MIGEKKEKETHLCVAFRIVDAAQHGAQLLPGCDALREHVVEPLLALEVRLRAGLLTRLERRADLVHRLLGLLLDVGNLRLDGAQRRLHAERAAVRLRNRALANAERGRDLDHLRVSSEGP